VRLLTDEADRAWHGLVNVLGDGEAVAARLIGIAEEELRLGSSADATRSA